MDHTALMRLLQALADLDAVLQHLIGRQRPFHEAIAQGLAFEVFHDQEIRPVLVADVMKGADVRVVQGRNRAGFALQALLCLEIGRKMRRQDLHRHGAIQTRVARAINLTHPARAQRGLNFVGSKFRAGG